MKDSIRILRVAIEDERDIVTARVRAREIAERLGFGNLDQARISAAISELTRNAYQYARGGTVMIGIASGPRPALWIEVTDSGPGIAHLNDVLSGSYVSKTGMGKGLLGTKKLMDSFEISTEKGKGTRIRVGKFLDEKGVVTEAELQSLSQQPGQQAGPDPMAEVQRQNRELISALEAVRERGQELNQINAELTETNRGVVALYAELDEKAESLRRVNEVKTKFLSNMTHEFRTPLSSIISLSRLLKSHIDGELTSEQEKQVTFIQKAAESLLELVNDLLDLAKVEAGKVAVQTSQFTVEDLLGGIRGIFRPLLDPSGVLKLEIDTGEPSLILETDEGKLAQILRNLVSNAIKYTERGLVKVSAKAEGAGVRFTCEDTGIGIADADLERIFDDFSQVESKLQKRRKGTGLGLPLSRKLARLLGGQLTVSSRLGKGSQFALLIPRVYRGEEVAKLVDDTRAEEKHDRFKILIVDDDDPSRYVLRSLISKHLDADFVEAKDGTHGFDLLATWHPDLVFLDLAMPGLDGFDFLGRIEQTSPRADLPIIVNTARIIDDREREFLESRVVAILSKDRHGDEDGGRRLESALRQAGFDFKERGLNA